MGTTILYVYGDGDYGAMTFGQNFNAQEVFDDMVAEGLTEKTLIFFDGDYEEELYCEIHRFGEVDLNFVSFLGNEFIDYDLTKAKDFHYVVDKERF